MKTNAGLWIDHQNTVIFRVLGEQETIQNIDSGISREQHEPFENGARRPSANRSNIVGSAVPNSEGKHEHRFENKLHKYYQEVVSAIKDVDELYVFGPGEAKTELETEIKKAKILSLTLKKVEAVDKMTEGQIKAKVKQYFKDRIA